MSRGGARRRTGQRQPRNSGRVRGDECPPVASLMSYCEGRRLWWVVTPGVPGSAHPWGMTPSQYEQIVGLSGGFHG